MIWAWMGRTQKWLEIIFILQVALTQLTNRSTNCVQTFNVFSWCEYQNLFLFFGKIVRIWSFWRKIIFFLKIVFKMLKPKGILIFYNIWQRWIFVQYIHSLYTMTEQSSVTDAVMSIAAPWSMKLNQKKGKQATCDYEM